MVPTIIHSTTMLLLFNNAFFNDIKKTGIDSKVVLTALPWEVTLHNITLAFHGKRRKALFLGQ